MSESNVILDPILEEPPPSVFHFLSVNGFIYRANTTTGAMDKLELDPSDKKKQVWVRIDDRSVSRG